MHRSLTFKITQIFLEVGGGGGGGGGGRASYPGPPMREVVS